MSRFKAHICFVSDQPLPNILPALHPDLKPEKIYLLSTALKKANANAQETVLKGRGIQVEIIDIPDAFHIDSIQENVDKIIKAHADKQELVLNATGGTKPMSIAAFKQCYKDDISVFYMQTPKVIWLSNTQQDELEIRESLSLKEYLQSHDVIMQSREIRGIPAKRREMAERWAGHWGKYSKVFSRLNKYASKAQNNELQVQIPKDGRSEDFNNWLRELEESSELLEYEKSLSDAKHETYRFKSENDRKFLNGMWLEEYVYDLLCSMKEQYPGITEVARNVEVQQHPQTTRKDVKNELDVVAIANQQMWVFECKTGQQLGKEGQHPGEEAVYKLASTMKNMGGLRTRGCIVSCNRLRDEEKSRAELLDIHVIDVDSVKKENLRSRLVPILGLNTLKE